MGIVNKKIRAKKAATFLAHSILSSCDGTEVFEKYLNLYFFQTKKKPGKVCIVERHPGMIVSMYSISLSPKT
mgnify:CR=1 FL=1